MAAVTASSGATPLKAPKRFPVSLALTGLLVAAVLAMWAYAEWVHPFAFGRATGRNFFQFVKEMAGILPAMFILVGLFDAWVPRHIVERHLGRQSGAMAVLWMVLLANLQAGPLYGAFPVAVALWRKGTAPRNVFIYLGAFSAMKIPMLTFEVTFLGWQFSLVRTLVTLPVFIALGFLLERLLPGDVTLPSLTDPAREPLHRDARSPGPKSPPEETRESVMESPHLEV
jgi:uncharacterized membrane protein YraQ (UPF0718 family)